MKILDHKRRPFIYALNLVIGFLVLIYNLRHLTNNYFFATASVLYMILIFELISTRFYANQLLSQYALPKAVDNSVTTQLIHHLLLPTILYISLVSYIFFNHQSSIEVFTLLLSFTSFYFLFTNIRAHFEDKYKLENKTKAIYDIVTIISIFLLSNSIISLFVYNALNIYFIIFILGIIFMLFAILFLSRINILSRQTVKYTIIYFLIITIFNALFSIYAQNIRMLSILQPLYFYYYLAITYHKTDGSLTKEIIIEYCVVFLLMSVLIISII